MDEINRTSASVLEPGDVGKSFVDRLVLGHGLEDEEGVDVVAEGSDLLPCGLLHDALGLRLGGTRADFLELLEDDVLLFLEPVGKSAWGRRG